MGGYYVTYCIYIPTVRPYYLFRTPSHFFFVCLTKRSGDEPDAPQDEGVGAGSGGDSGLRDGGVCSDRGCQPRRQDHFQVCSSFRFGVVYSAPCRHISNEVNQTVSCESTPPCRPSNLETVLHKQGVPCVPARWGPEHRVAGVGQPHLHDRARGPRLRRKGRRLNFESSNILNLDV